MMNASKPASTNQDLARDAAKSGRLLRGNNALEVYAPFIIFFHHALRWSYDDLVEHLNVALAPLLGKEKVTRRKIETILTKYRNGKLHVAEEEIESIAAADPVYLPFLERWRHLGNPAAPPTKVEKGEKKPTATHPRLPKPKKRTPSQPPMTAKSDVEASEHYEKMLTKGPEQAKIAESLRKMIRPE